MRQNTKDLIKPQWGTTWVLSTSFSDQCLNCGAGGEAE